MIKGFRQIASLTVVSRIFGMIRDICFSHFFGSGWLMTAWTMGFKLPNLSRRLFGEGAASASFIPVYSEQLHLDPKSARQLVNTMITVMFVFLSSLVLIGEVILWAVFYFTDIEGLELGLSLAGIMLPYMTLVCIVAILAGILNVHRHFAAPAAAPIILNLFIIAAFLFTGWQMDIPPAQQAFWVAFAVLAAGLIQIAIQLPPLKKSGVSFKPAWKIHSPAFKKVLLLMGPMILGLTVTQLNTMADDLIALAFSNKNGTPLPLGAVGHLYYAQRLYQFPLGVLGISLATAIFPVMSHAAARKDMTELNDIIAKGLKGSVFIAVPAAVGLILVADPLVALIFGHGEFQPSDIPVVGAILSAYAIGLCGYFGQQMLARAYYSLQDSKMPAITAAIAVAINIMLNLILIWPLGAAGLALSTAICSYLQIAILLSVLRKRFDLTIFDGFFPSTIKTLTATAVMWISGMAALHYTRNLPDTLLWNAAGILTVVFVSGGIYILLSVIMKNEMVHLITGRTKK